MKPVSVEPLATPNRAGHQMRLGRQPLSALSAPMVTAPPGAGREVAR